MSEHTAAQPREEHVVPFPRHAIERHEVDSETLKQLTKLFERSAKRWEIVVYPSLVAFVILALYGFYLIYSLTSDIHRIARSIDPEMGPNMKQMTVSMAAMPEILKKMDSMDQTMRGMGYGVHAMANSNQQMNHSMATMTNSVARPMSMINAFMPW